MLQALSSPFRNLMAGVIFVVAITIASTFAYVEQGWPLGDAFYMVVITIFTVGYGEVRPIDTTALRAITMLLMFTGCTGMIFLTGALVQLITVSQFQAFFGTRRMQKDIDELSNHVIICGYGRIGQSLIVDLKAGGQQFVVVDRGDARLEAARVQGCLVIQGDATDEETLKKAGILRARALTTVLPDDAANVFITLSARSLKKNLVIISRGEIPSTERKLIQAGADRVVLPAHIGAERIAELLLFKEMANLRDSSRMAKITHELKRIGLDMEIVAAAEKSRAAGATVQEVETLAGGSFMIVAVEHADGSTIFQPPASLRLAAGEGIAVVGRPTRTGAMQAIFGTPARAH